MSHTNSTTNYNLPQFVGTDKPTWLNDVNGAFASIDAQMKLNADSATSASTSATTANNAIGTLANLETTAKTDLVSAVNEVKAGAGTAQETANTAIGSANAVATALNIFEQKFNLSNITQGTENNYTKTGIVINETTLAQNSDGSIFKFYGKLQVNPNSSVTRSAIAGMSGYNGVDVGLVLSKAPSSAYIVKCSGMYCEVNDSNCIMASNIEFAVGTNGHIYIDPTTSTNPIRPKSGGTVGRLLFFPAIYFNDTFGDTPSTSNN